MIRVELDPPPAATAPLRGRRLWRRWTGVVAVAETVGFAVPAVTGAGLVATGAPFPVIAVAALIAGAIEGAILGLAQATALRLAVPTVRSREWIAATVTAR